MVKPFVSMMITDTARSLGFQVELEPEFNYLGEIVFPDGYRHLFHGQNMNINPSGSDAIASDKGYSNYLLRNYGFQVPESKTFFSGSARGAPSDRGLMALLDYIHITGWPVFMKPNNMSNGRLVTCVSNSEEAINVAEMLFSQTDIIVVEKKCTGRDYRVVVLDGEVVAAYERIPPAVTGDGHSTVQQLLMRMKSELEHPGGRRIQFSVEDFRIDKVLEKQGVSRNCIIPTGKKITLLDNANLSAGGVALDYTETIHPSFIRLAIGSTAALGLSLAGVDFICQNIEEDAETQMWSILEVNSNPGMEHYAASGIKQMGCVSGIFKKIILRIAKNHY